MGATRRGTTVAREGTRSRLRDERDADCPDRDRGGGEQACQTNSQEPVAVVSFRRPGQQGQAAHREAKVGKVGKRQRDMLDEHPAEHGQARDDQERRGREPQRPPHDVGRRRQPRRQRNQVQPDEARRASQTRAIQCGQQQRIPRRVMGRLLRALEGDSVAGRGGQFQEKRGIGVGP